jgi:molybdopterin molybdotransferase
MRSVDDHLAHVLAAVHPLAPIDMQILDAHGCILADDVRAATDLPPFDNSAMDGYAVRHGDVAAASDGSPVELPVVGDVAAGSSSTYSVQPGFTTRIMTGAPVPSGTEAVIPVEWTDRGMATVTIRQAPAMGQHIRRRGEDVAEGDVILTAGTRLGPTQVGLIAAAGHDRVRVRPRPRVVVISTGSELVAPGHGIGPGQISESNSYLITAAAKDAGALAFRVGIVPDDARAIMASIEDQLIRADLVLTTGGVSEGAYDVVKEVLSRLGTVEFGKVAMQPGMPQGFGAVGPDSIPIFTLPGNPVSAYVSFEVFVRPVLRKMLGVEPLERPVVLAVAGDRFTSPHGKRSYLRGILDVVDGRYVVGSAGGQGSHVMSSLSRSNALVIMPEEVTAVEAGASVQVMVLERRFS